VLLGAVVAGAFLLPGKWSPKTCFPRQLGGEPATCRELVERLRARGMNLQMRPYNHGHPAVCVSESDTALLVLQEAHVRFEGVAIIVQFPTAQEAREEAGTEENAFAWGRFMIRADEQMLTQIKRRL
jgi:hypothetical protein